MKDDYTTNSAYLTYTSLLKKGTENVLFEVSPGSVFVKRCDNGVCNMSCPLGSRWSPNEVTATAMCP